MSKGPLRRPDAAPVAATAAARPRTRRTWAAWWAALGLLLAGPLRADPAILDLSGMTFVASRGEVSELVLRSESARLHTGTEEVQLRDVEARVADSDERQGFEMRCDRGTLNLRTNDFRAEGRVRGTTFDGRRFSAPWVSYRHEQGLLFTDAPVEIREESGIAYQGGGFRYFVRERRFKLLRGATLIQEDT